MPLKRVTKLPSLAPRAADSHKGTFGRVLVFAGSRGMAGAAVLCGSAALRGGAGLVRVATPHDAWPIVAAGNPCYMTLPLAQDAQGRFTAGAWPELLHEIERSDVVALGPGLGRGADVAHLVATLVSQAAVPLVLDADGLAAFEEHPGRIAQHAGPLIITPHPGEFARLLKTDAAHVQAQREKLAAQFAEAHKLVVVLKGQGTIVTDGTRCAVNRTGNPGMATAGSGDVLTGVIAALLAQGLEAFEAAQLGVHLHGLAGDLARRDLGEVGLIATDLLTYLPRALRRGRGK